MKKHLLSFSVLLCTAVAGLAQPCNDHVVATFTPNPPICSGKSFSLHASPVPGATYSWSTAFNNFKSGKQDTTISSTPVTMSGKFIITATVGPCVYTDTVDVTIDITPAKPTIADDTIVCANDTIVIASTANPGVTYDVWGPNSFSITNASGSIPTSFIDTGMYYVRAVSTVGCISDTTAWHVKHIYPALTPTVTLTVAPDSFVTAQGGTLTFTGSVSNGGSNPTTRWTINGNQYSASTFNNPVNVVPNDKVCLWLRSWPTCKVDTAMKCITVHEKVGIHTIDKDKAGIFPNPNRGRFKLFLPSANRPEIEVVNTLGAVVFKQQLASGNDYHDIDLGTLPNGTYTMVCRTAEKVQYLHFAIAN